MAEIKQDNQERPVKKNSKVLHFSDGTIEYNSSEEDEIDNVNNTNTSNVADVNPSSLGWTDWLMYKATVAGQSTIETCDYIGERLAHFFGITTPKYQFEIDHYNTLKQMEAEDTDIELGNGTERNTTASTTLTASC